MRVILSADDMTIFALHMNDKLKVGKLYHLLLGLNVNVLTTKRVVFRIRFLGGGISLLLIIKQTH